MNYQPWNASLATVTMSDDNSSLKKFDLELRNAHWKALWELGNAQIGRMNDNLWKAINSAFLLNGGTAIALLTLLGALKKNEFASAPVDQGVLFALPALGFGLLCAMIGFWFSYKQSAEYGNDVTTRTLLNHFPFSGYDPVLSPKSMRLHNSYLHRAKISLGLSVFSSATALLIFSCRVFI